MPLSLRTELACRAVAGICLLPPSRHNHHNPPLDLNQTVFATAGTKYTNFRYSGADGRMDVQKMFQLCKMKSVVVRTSVSFNRQKTGQGHFRCRSHQHGRLLMSSSGMYNRQEAEVCFACTHKKLRSNLTLRPTSGTRLRKPPCEIDGGQESKQEHGVAKSPAPPTHRTQHCHEEKKLQRGVAQISGATDA